jgi:hypothetical protein
VKLNFRQTGLADEQGVKQTLRLVAE